MEFCCSKVEIFWNRREAARADFKSKPFFARWDPSALDVYIECGLTEDKLAKSQKSSVEVAGPPGPVKLKTSPLSEAAVFVESRVAYESWEVLADVSDDVELWWIVPGIRDLWWGVLIRVPLFGVDKPALRRGEDAIVDRIQRRPSNSTRVTIANSGHLVRHIFASSFISAISPPQIPQEDPKALGSSSRFKLPTSAYLGE
jgi:hypothetical protein